MKITDVEVDGFGIWRGLKLDGLSQQLTVFYGPNEAGKTTLMQFLRAMLYGFSPERRVRYVPPVAGGDAGGLLQVTDGVSPLTIRRCVSADGLTEDLEIDDDAGNFVDPAELLRQLGDVDERLYNSVFAFGLDEIQELRTLGEGEAARLLYDLSLGLEHVSLSDVLTQLRVSRERLLASDDRPCLIPQLVAQRERLVEGQRELQKSSHQYLELRASADQVDREIVRREAEQQQSSISIRNLEHARSLADPWRRRGQLDAQLAVTRSAHVLPADAGRRYDHLNRRIQQRRSQRQALNSEQKQLTEELAAVQVNQALSRLAPRLEALSEQQQWMGALADETRKLEEEVDSLQAQRDERRQQWGLSAKQGGGSIKSAMRTSLRSAAKDLRDARRELKALHQKAAVQQETGGAAAKKLQSALSSRDDADLHSSIEKAGELVSQLRRRIQLDERLDQMSRRETDLGEEAKAALEKQVLPGWLVGTLGGAFSIGGGLVVGGLLLPTSIFMLPAMPAIVAGASLVGASGITKFRLQRRAADRLDRSQRQLVQLQEQREASLRERDELDKVLPRGGGPLTVRLQKAERELEELEQLLPLAAEQHTASQSARSADEVKRQARIDWQKAVQRWQTLLAETGIPKSLKPSQLRGYLRHARDLHELDRRLHAKRDEMAERLGRLGAMQSRIMQLAAEIGLKSTSEEPLAVLREMLMLLQQQQAMLERREAIEKQLRDFRQRTRLLQRAVGKLKRRRQALLVELGVQDEAQLRRRLADQAEGAKLEEQRSELHAQIQQSLAGIEHGDAVSELLAGGANLDQLRTQAEDSASSVRSTLSQLFERRGQLTQQIKHLAEDRRLAEKQFELELVSQRLREAIDRWRVLAICGLLLEAVRDYYERERQPAALREASHHLERLTSGKYLRVWTPFGERQLRVDDADGKSLPIEVLSRGTREQLFLALRLALVTLYAQRGVRLPLILDDVLVNFDAPRTKAAATVLRDFARAGQQILFFTCHDHISKLLKSLRSDVRVLPDRAGSSGSPAEIRSTKRTAKPQTEVIGEAEDVEDVTPATPIEVPPAPMATEFTVPAPRTEPVIVDTNLEPSTSQPERKPVAAAVPPPTVAPMIDDETVAQKHQGMPPARQQPPKRGPKPKRLRRVEQSVQQIRWDAEEFDGELVDRVAQSHVVEMGKLPGENGHSPHRDEEQAQASDLKSE